MSAVEVASDLIRRFEGCHKKRGDLFYPYLDPVGIPTQGWGVVVKDLHVKPITQAEADEALETLIPIYMAQVIQYCPALLGDAPRLGAITDFVYNLGVGRLRSSTLRVRVNDRNWPEAAKEIRKWVWGGGVKLPGLIRRRDAEAALLWHS